MTDLFFTSLDITSIATEPMILDGTETGSAILPEYVTNSIAAATVDIPPLIYIMIGFLTLVVVITVSIIFYKAYWWRKHRKNRGHVPEAERMLRQEQDIEMRAKNFIERRDAARAEAGYGQSNSVLLKREPSAANLVTEL